MTYEITLPPGIERAIFTVVRQYTALHPIPRGKLVEDVTRLGFPADERQVREAIKSLRRRGYLICATAGTGGGYYLAHSPQEFDDFDRRELTAKINDLLETRKAMREAARERFGEGVQIGLF